jgi:hypothetical protein
MNLTDKEIELLKTVFAIAQNVLDRELKDSQFLTDEQKIELINKYASVDKLALRVYQEY